MCVKPLQSPQHFCKTSQGADSGPQAEGPVPTAPEPPSLDQRQEQGSPRKPWLQPWSLPRHPWDPPCSSHLNQGRRLPAVHSLLLSASPRKWGPNGKSLHRRMLWGRHLARAAGPAPCAASTQCCWPQLAGGSKPLCYHLIIYFNGLWELHTFCWQLLYWEEE